LKSYSKIKWNRIYLRIKLDTEFQGRQEELTDWINLYLPGADLVFTRYEYQHEWRELIEKICEEDDLIWFTQNDDHVFVDDDAVYLESGIELLRKDQSIFKTIYFSHWPEILRLSGKCGHPERIGDWVKFKCTLVDSIQVFNSNYLRFLFIDLDWGGREMKRIDTLLVHRGIWGSGNIIHSLQTVYVPLKELCRKFNGYDFISKDEAPALSLEINTCSRTTENVKRLAKAPSMCSLWTNNNTFSIPDEWIQTTLRLYNLKE
jgi:hypothetical protein